MSNTTTRKPVAEALLEIGAVGFSPDEPIQFKSGIFAPVYVDNRQLIFYPAQWRIIIEAFQRLIEAEALAMDVVAGVAVGGVPHSSALAYTLGKPTVFVRKESKEHGAKRLVEGGDVQRRRVVLVEDLVTTGGSSLRAVEHLREAGAIVTDALAIVSYGFAESKQAFRDADVRLSTLTDFDAIMEAGQASGRFGSTEIEVIRDWLKDPYHWIERRHTT
jgi:orotate phosphoribosyltransferase